MKDVIKNLNIKLFADGADLESIKKFNKNPFVSCFTTHPTLMRSSGVLNYEHFVKEAFIVNYGLFKN